VAGAVTLERPLAVGPDAAWAALAELGPAQGSAGGYTGTASVVDLDDDERVATLRLVGGSGTASVAVLATVGVRESALTVAADVTQGPGGRAVDDETIEEALGHLATTLAYALAVATRPRRAWDTSVPPTPTPTPTAWDAPSLPPAHAPREPIAATATLSPAAPRAARPGPGRRELPVVAPPVAHEVLTPRRRDMLGPGGEPVRRREERRWVTAGVAAAAGLAALRILRGRR
jgi:hypothetical protein